MAEAGRSAPRRWLLGILVLAVIVSLVVGAQFVLRASPGGAGFAAKQLCSLVYVSGLSRDVARALYVDAAVYPMGLALTASYDDARQRVTTTAFGIWSARAERRVGLGCTVTTTLDESASLPPVRLPAVASIPLERTPPDVFADAFDPQAVDDALERAFVNGHHTLAVAVLHRGGLVADRFADDIDHTTPLPGWSMAKSMTATLVGLLVQRGRIDVDASGAVSAWRGRSDGGEAVTLDQLLRMTSGLDVEEDQSGADPNTRMLFMEPDGAGFSASRGLQAAPGTHWEYMSGSSVLAARAVVEATGGTLASSQAFMRTALFRPLGAASFEFEPDLAGTFIGSSFLLGAAHDWAKLGQLYLNDGLWNGRRLLPEGWREYVTRHTPLSGADSYGAGFWTVEHAGDSRLPRDTFFASGFQGQTIAVIPSRELVVVRLGASHGPTGTWQLITELLDAMR